MVESKVVILVLALITLAVLAAVYYYTSVTIKESSNVETVKSWVLLKSESVGIAGPDRPPVSPLSEPIEINAIEQVINPASKNSAHKLIADALYDCWNAFGSGKYDFMGNEKVFCYPCTAIVFSDKVKQSKRNIENFDAYLATTQAGIGKSAKTYAEHLNEDPTFLKASSYFIDTKEDKYIFFISTEGLTWIDVLTGAGAIHMVAGAVAAVSVTGPFAVFTAPLALPSAVIATAGTTIGGVYLKLSGTQDYRPMVWIGSADDINKICSTAASDIILNKPIDMQKAQQKPKPENFDAAVSTYSNLKNSLSECYNSKESQTYPFSCTFVKNDLPKDYTILITSNSIGIFYKTDGYGNEILSNYKIKLLPNPQSAESYYIKEGQIFIVDKPEQGDFVSQINIYKCSEDDICINPVMNSMRESLPASRELAKAFIKQ